MKICYNSISDGCRGCNKVFSIDFKPVKQNLLSTRSALYPVFLSIYMTLVNVRVTAYPTTFPIFVLASVLQAACAVVD